MKIESIVTNARAYLKLLESYESFDKFLWAYVDNEPIINYFNNMEDIETTSELSIKLSKDLKKLGFKFVGPTTTYAFMEAIGMINNHISYCDFKHK